MARRFEMVGGKLTQVSGSPETDADRARYSDRLQDMLKSRSAPRGMTDSVYFEGKHNLAQQWGEAEALDIVANAQRNYGFTPSPGMLYDPQCVPEGGLSGHPNAFYDQAGGIAQRRQMIRNIGSFSENLGMKPPDNPPPDLDSPRIADDIVINEARKRIEPGRKKLNKKESSKLLDQVREEMTL